MAKDEFRQIERIEVNPKTGEKRTIYKAKGFEKLKNGKAITKILATFIAIITAFSIFTNLKQETPQTAFEMFKDNPKTIEKEIGWIEYNPNIPRFKVTLERLANSFEENLLPTLQLKMRKEIIQDNWGAFNWLRNFINTALISTISLATTVTNIVITIVNSIFNVGQLLLSL